MRTQKPVLAFLQNMWVKNPERVKAEIKKHGEEYRTRLLRYCLFAGCKTGRNLTKAFGEDLLELIAFEETTREIAGDPKTIFPADASHIGNAITVHKPLIVVTFGTIAREAVQPYWTGMFIKAHHPASRNTASYQTLTDAATRLRGLLTDLGYA